MINWHRLFGIALFDFFRDSPFSVELEKDVSVKRQWLDIVIFRKEAGAMQKDLPDGLDNLAEHNLLTYKSFNEPFDDWALKELTGHYVHYRKQVSSSLEQLLPEKAFQLYGVSTRMPKKLSNQVRLEPLSEGVFEVTRGTDKIRLIVLSRISAKKHNTLWNLFSGIPTAIEHAALQYRSQPQEMSTIINQLFEKYQMKGITMPYTMEDFQKDYIMSHLDQIPPDEVLQKFSPDERLKGLASDEVLQRFSPDEVLQRFSPDEVLQKFSPDERLKGLPLEEIQDYLKRMQKQSKE